MSVKSQQNNMKTIAGLLSTDLGYIFGERECGPNGAKKAFLSKSRAFLSALGKDLGLDTQKVTVNPAGIAVSGDACLKGFWSSGNGLCVRLEQLPAYLDRPLVYYRLDGSGRQTGSAGRLTHKELAQADYVGLLSRLSGLRGTEGCYERVA